MILSYKPKISIGRGKLFIQGMISFFKEVTLGRKLKPVAKYCLIIEIFLSFLSLSSDKIV